MRTSCSARERRGLSLSTSPYRHMPGAWRYRSVHILISWLHLLDACTKFCSFVHVAVVLLNLNCDFQLRPSSRFTSCQEEFECFSPSPIYSPTKSYLQLTDISRRDPRVSHSLPFSKFVTYIYLHNFTAIFQGGNLSKLNCSIPNPALIGKSLMHMTPCITVSLVIKFLSLFEWMMK